LSFINQVEKVKIDEDFFVVRLLEEVSFYPTRIAEKQSLQQVEDEESNSQWWINHNVEEEEEGEMNSQNLEREYCAFNEMWEEGKNDESGGANGKVQEKSLIPASPKKAAHSAIGVRERKENSPSTTQMGPHYATKDNFILDSTGVLFTGVLGPIKRPIREVHEVTGSGSGPGIMTQKNQVELIENSQRKYRKKQNPSTYDGDNEYQQQQDNICLQEGILDGRESDDGSCDRSMQFNSENQELNNGEDSTAEVAQTLTQPLSAEVNSESNQTVEQNQEKEKLKKKRRRRTIPKMKDLARAMALMPKKKKKKQVRTNSTSNGNTVASDSSNQVNILLDSSCSREISEWRKWVLLHEEPSEVASKVWEFGRKEGVSFSDDEGGVVKELEAIERRDREKMGVNISKGNQSGESNRNGL
jgi:hypothetical protein